MPNISYRYLMYFMYYFRFSDVGEGSGLCRMEFSWWMAAGVGLIFLILTLVTCCYLRNRMCRLRDMETKLMSNPAFFEKAGSRTSSGDSINFNPQVITNTEEENRRLRRKICDLEESKSVLEGRLKMIEDRLSASSMSTPAFTSSEDTVDIGNRDKREDTKDDDIAVVVEEDENADEETAESKGNKTTMSTVLDNTFWGEAGETRSTHSEPVYPDLRRSGELRRQLGEELSRSGEVGPRKPPREYTTHNTSP